NTYVINFYGAPSASQSINLVAQNGAISMAQVLRSTTATGQISLSLTSNTSTLTTGNVDLSGLGGIPGAAVNAAIAGAGGSGGNLLVSASGTIQTGYLRAYGGGGGGTYWCTDCVG